MVSNMKTSRVSWTVISTIYKNISPKSVSILSRLLYRPSIGERRCNRGIHIGNSGNWTNYGNGWQHLESIVLQNPYDRWTSRDWSKGVPLPTFCFLRQETKILLINYEPLLILNELVSHTNKYVASLTVKSTPSKLIFKEC